MTTLPTGQRSTAVAEFIKNLSPSHATHSAGGRLIFALDATASREPTWDRACQIQGQMFEATAGLGGLDVQLVFYRGFDECKASRWMTSAADLHRAMRSVHCVGGETQIERILGHAIRETQMRKVNALVFVGDAMEEKLDRLCRLAGELGKLGAPIFLFYEDTSPALPPYVNSQYFTPSASDALRAFQQLASLTHGTCLSFDLAGIDRLKELLGAVAVYASGGVKALASYGEKKGGEVVRLHQLQLNIDQG